MAGPWEQYGSAQGPWSQYAAPQATPSATGSIGSQIYDAGKAAISNVAEAFNPYSATNTARFEAERNAPLLDISNEVGRLGDVAKSVASIPAVPGSVLAPAISAAGKAYDVVSPTFTPQQKAQLEASGVRLPTGEEAVSTALMGARPVAASPAGIVTKPAPLPSSAALKDAGKAVYNDPAIKSITFDPAFVTSRVMRAGNELVGQGFRPTPESAPATFRELNALMPPEPKPVDYWTRVEAEMNGQPVPTNTVPVKTVSVDDLRAARRALNKTAGLRDQLGKATPDAEAARQVIGHIDDMIGSAAPELATANANYSAGKAADTLDFRTQRADRRAAKTGSGSNIENTMRQEADKIPTRGLAPDAKELLDQIVLGTPARNALRKVGKLGFSDGLSLMYHAGLTLPTAGANLPIGAAATVARKVGEGLTRSQLNQLSEMIRARAPLAKSAAPVPVSAPNPLLANIPVSQLQQLFPLRGLLGVVPAPADQQQ